MLLLFKTQNPPHTTASHRHSFCIFTVLWFKVSLLSALNHQPCIINRTELLANRKGSRLLTITYHFSNNPVFKCSYLWSVFEKRTFSVLENTCLVLIKGQNRHFFNAPFDMVSLLSLFSAVSLTALLLRLSLLALRTSSPLQPRSMIVINLTASQRSLAPCRYLVCAVTEAVRLCRGCLQ